MRRFTGRIIAGTMIMLVIGPLVGISTSLKWLSFHIDSMQWPDRVINVADRIEKWSRG